MKYALLSLFAVLSLGCGRLPETPDAGGLLDKPQSPPIVITAPPKNLCDVAQDALYCADGGVPMGRVAGVPNVASIGLFARFEAAPSFSHLHGRLVELGGDSGPGGGAALSVSGSGATLTVGCAWWNSMLGAWAIEASLSAGEHAAYCEIDANGARLYVDGVLAASETAMPYHSTVGVLGLKRAAYSNSFDFNGTIEEVAIFSSLTLDEIALISE